MGVEKLYGEQGTQAMVLGRQIYRANESRKASLIQDKILEGLKKAGFSYEIAARVVWEIGN